MRILLLIADPFFNRKSGADHRNWRHAKVLEDHAELLCVSIYPADQPTTDFETINIGSRDARDYWKGGIYRFTGEEVGNFSRILNDYEPDLVVAEGVAFCELFDVIKASASRLVVDMHNIESELARQIAKTVPFWRPSRRFRHFNVANALRIAEQRAAEIADRVWVCSQNDAARLSKLTSRGDADVVPNVVPDGLMSGHMRSDYRPNLCFLGHLGYRPNVLAAVELANEIFPRLRSLEASASLTIAGRSPPRAVRRLIREGVTVLADPPDMRPILASADFAVLPLRQGGGTRIKALEAMASGLIVVATAKAVEGLDLTPEKHFLLAEQPDEMAEKVSHLVRNPVEAAAIASAAHDVVQAFYSAEALSQIIRVNVKDLMGCFVLH